MSEKTSQDNELPSADSGRRSLVLAACMMATFMAAVESTIVATAMPTIVAALGDFHLFSWVFGAYLLFQAVSVPIYGRLSDFYGRRRMFLIGATIFLVGSTLCGFAQGMLSLIVFRALQGMGAGAIQPIAYTIVGDIYTPTERARLQGLLSSMFGIAAVVGPTLGAFLVDHFDWRIIFWINLPIGALAIGMLLIFFREQPHAQRRKIDLPASLLLTLGAGALMMAMIQGSRLPLWLLGACIVVGVGALVVLVRHERHLEAPMLPLRLWTNRVIAIGNFGSFGIGLVILSVSGFLPIYVQGVLGLGAATSGITLGTSSIAWAVASALAGRIMIRTSYRVTAVLGGAMLVLGSLLLATLTPERGAVWAGTGALSFGLGMGFCNTTYLISVQGAASLRDRGAAIASNLFMRIVGQAVGAALFAAIVNTGLDRYAPGAHEVAERLMESALRHQLTAGDLTTLTTAMGHAIQNAYFAAAVLSAVVILFGVCLPATLSPTTAPKPA
jgi:EmrB/QacA subfamily drug resistance transporter